MYFIQDDSDHEADELLRRAWRSLPNARTAATGPMGRPFLLDDHGVGHQAFNAFFSSGRMRNRSTGTNRKYAFALKVWLNFLELRGVAWDEATEHDLFDFKFWRRTDPRNPRPVSGSTWSGDLVAISAFRNWAALTQGRSSVLAVTGSVAHNDRFQRIGDVRARASTIRSADVKWLSPGAYRQWRDVGIHGIAPDGHERTRWRPRSQTRDAAFVDGLYGSGLRLQEWSSLLMNEIHEPGRANFVTHRLADACAKGERGHRYWLKREVVNAVAGYVETERAAAVRRAQTSGLYERIRGLRVVTETHDDGRLRVMGAGGLRSVRRMNDIRPEERAVLFIRCPEGLAPLSLWLNEDGIPRPKRSWYKSFERANARVKRAGIERLECHPHMLRHSFALRWYAVGRMIWENRYRNPIAHRELDFREQFGDTWSLVQTMLGHADVNTTKNIYLEPFQSLDIRLLLEYGTNELQAEALLQVLRSDPRVRLEDSTLGGGFQ